MEIKAEEEGGAIIEDAVQKAVEFHGHLGPFLVLGVRMGHLAKRELGSSGFEGMRAVAKTGNVPSLSCLLDGIQISTGCTMGNGKISAEPPGIPEAEFSAGEKKVTIRAKGEVVEEIRRWRERYASLEEIARSIQGRSDEELFGSKAQKR
ncbi:formylmethanofuran dehydrogenase subunit E family protein [Methanotrichaceae archaeon M04Ac]|uniref:Formylmethanofuran dehydrogenase subunit E family protein n=1 Tax=Candidatus Methanocrinis alkalitolerans TaxID=3033395 RepID=A0ABT5XEA2_9EURY|nr:formylmethanofuran dehydrogenase subunit E family protein [Candidatus Methanocrinis alkalitolerans]MCR3884510.1 formylmethanofuran dehydrogenase subunit E family protein [Methanothrix sp.]MDF0593012.1 formylmethanofuran dehydrogenase subunit E family protein [Candidatus Methanocrinis alkalitolerans]